MKKTVLMVAALLCTFACFAQVVDFEDLTLNPNSSWIGADGTGQFTSSYLTLYNDYSSQYGSWQGFAYTNGTDTESNSYSNLSSCVGHGASNSDYYVTAYIGTDWMGDNSQIPVGMKINTENAGDFANRGAYFCMPVLLKKWVDREYASNHFYFKLKASAYANGTLIGDSEIMMADFTEGNSYMMDDWTYVDLSWIANADSLYFTAISNDTAGGYGINTPLYFSMDNFGVRNPYPEIVDFEEFDLEPNTHGNSTERTGSFTSSYLTLYSHYDEDYGPEYAYLEGFVYTNETDVDTYSYTNYSAAVGHGNGNSSNYVNCYMGWYNTSAIKIDTEHSGDFTNRGAYFCLPTYVSKYVDDENAGFVENHKYFSVKITAYANGTALDNREVVMADFREDRTYKMDDWTFVDLSWINGADSLYFEALGSDPMTPYYFSMDDFGAMAPVTITATAGENGSITPNGEIEVFYGSNKEFEITPAEGYRIASVIVDAATENEANVTENIIDGVYTFVNVTANHTINATFELIPTYIITATAGEGGSINPAEVTVEEGENAEFTITANEGYRILSVIVDAETGNESNVTSNLVEGVFTFVYVIANHTIDATFEEIPTYTITATAGENGTITPAEVTVEEGENAEFTITPAEGYEIASVIVDADTEDEEDVSEELTYDDGIFTYTFENVTANHTIHATFRELQTYTITVNITGNGTVVAIDDDENEIPAENGVITVNHYDDVYLVITPAEHNLISSVYVNGSEMDLNAYGDTLPLLAVEENYTVNVTFVPEMAVDMVEAGSMSIYPNPNNGMFSIDFSNIEGDATYQLIDARGTIVETLDINVMSGETMNFNHNINAGTYFVRIISGDKVYVEQIVIE